MTAPIAATAAPVAPAAPPGRHGEPAPSPSFHAVLSALNPLQYLPVIGTIYRAVTGDTIPDAIRRVGSLIVSALTGGPIGIVINLATMVAEKASGIDLDRAGQALLLGGSIDAAIVGDAPPAGGHAAGPPVGVAAADRPPAVQQARQDTVRPSAAENIAAAEPLGSAPAFTLQLGAEPDADDLNGLELARIHSANVAYARVAALVR